MQLIKVPKFVLKLASIYPLCRKGLGRVGIFKSQSGMLHAHVLAEGGIKAGVTRLSCITAAEKS